MSHQSWFMTISLLIIKSVWPIQACYAALLSDAALDWLANGG